jgi:hypothetical protein
LYVVEAKQVFIGGQFVLLPSNSEFCEDPTERFHLGTVRRAMARVLNFGGIIARKRRKKPNFGMSWRSTDTEWRSLPGNAAASSNSSTSLELAVAPMIRNQNRTSKSAR